MFGAVIAGIFYEFIFSPTRKHSLCYRPKIFRLTALDMAQIGLKSRLFYQQQNQQHQQLQSQQPLYQQYQYQQHQNQHLYQQPHNNNASSYQTHQNQHQPQNQSRHFHTSSNSSQRPLSTIYRPGNALYQSAADEFVHSANPTWQSSAGVGNGYLNSELPSSRLNVRGVDKFNLH